MYVRITAPTIYNFSPNSYESWKAEALAEALHSKPSLVAGNPSSYRTYSTGTTLQWNQPKVETLAQ